MKIHLIAPILADLGVSTISPLLKARGHSVKLLYVPDLLEDCTRPLSKKAMNTIIDFVRESNILGINGPSENYHKTAILVDYIKKKTGITIIWGGIHATLRPQDCLEYADIVCVGEGEEAMIELIDALEAREDCKNIKNLLFQWGKSERIELRPPVDLDSLLPLDYDLDSQYILEDNKTRNLREADFKGQFIAFSSRGCPYTCSYCCNINMHRIYKGHRYCRQRSVENIINDLKIIKRRFSSCKLIWFNDADFLSGKTQREIKDFANRYKAEIHIPFGGWSNPAGVNEENISVLKPAGLKYISIGTIEGNDDIQTRIYNRNAIAEYYLSRSETLKKYGIEVHYNVILCNPYENDKHLINTITLLMRLPKPFKTVIHSLTYFPETDLYKMALKDGIITEYKQAQSYTKAAYKAWKFRSQSTYLNVVLSLMRGMARKVRYTGIIFYGLLPEPVLKFLIKKPVIKFFNHLPLKSIVFDIIANFIIATHRFVRYLQKKLDLTFHF